MNPTIHFSFQKTFYIMGCLALIVVGLHYGKPFFMPFSFAILLSCILMPIVRWLVKRGLPNVWSIILTFLTLMAILVGITYFFSSQIANLISDIQNFVSQFDQFMKQAIERYNQELSFMPDLGMSDVKDKTFNYLENSGGNIIGQTLGTTSSILSNLVLVLVFTFMMLLYRRGIKNGIINFFRPYQQKPIRLALNEAQKVGMQYLSGTFTVMIILAVVNTGALMLIGVDYAIMFATLGALLIFIPYIGSFLGAILPAIYALATMDTKSALLVLGAFTVIQVIEGNFLTPKIVGDSTKINPLVSFSVLLIGGSIWGIPGMVLGLPLTAMANRIFKHLFELRPLSTLLSTKVADNEIEIAKNN